MEQVTAKSVEAMLRRHLRSRSDLGLCNAVRAHILESQNPFEPPSVRKPRLWFVLFLIMSSALIGAFAYFNLWN